MIKLKGYRHTLLACFIGYSTQSMTVGVAPLLYVHFSKIYSIPLSQITLLISLNFLVQLSVDYLATYFVNKSGYRVSLITASALVAAGLVCLAVLPSVLPNPFLGLLISTVIYAAGGGMEEVVFNPVAENCPTKNKSGIMSLLHSFFCWGMLALTLFSTLFFNIFGIVNWKYLVLFLAMLPFLNAVYFSVVPIPEIPAETESKGFLELLKSKTMSLMLLFMLCAGASEIAMSQWSSAFAETGLRVSKTVGDLLGPSLFALLMGCARVLYTKLSRKISLKAFMTFSSVLCVFSYLLTVFSPYPVLSLMGCAITGFSVGIMWPGTISLATKSVPNGGMKMYSLLALFGDAGCTLGPSAVGFVSSAFNDNLKTGILFAGIFPLALLLGLIFLKKGEDNGN